MIFPFEIWILVPGMRFVLLLIVLGHGLLLLVVKVTAVVRIMNLHLGIHHSLLWVKLSHLLRDLLIGINWDLHGNLTDWSVAILRLHVRHWHDVWFLVLGVEHLLLLSSRLSDNSILDFGLHIELVGLEIEFFFLFGLGWLGFGLSAGFCDGWLRRGGGILGRVELCILLGFALN